MIPGPLSYRAFRETGPRTLTEATEEEEAKDDEIQPEDNTPQASTTSGRRLARNTENFRLCLLLMVADIQCKREGQLSHYY